MAGAINAVIASLIPTSGSAQAYFASAVDDGTYDLQFHHCAIGQSGETVFVGARDPSGVNMHPIIQYYAAAGTLSWTVKITLNQTQATGVAISTAGDVYVSGYSNNGNAAFVAKYNASGVLQWQREVTKTGWGMNWVAVALDSSTNVIIAFQNGASNRNVGVLKYDSAGILQWQAEWSYVSGLTGHTTPSFVAASGVAVDPTDSSLRVAWTEGASDFCGVYDVPTFAKITSDGATLSWTVAAGSGLSNGVACDASGNAYALSSTPSTSTLVKLNTAGVGGTVRYLGAVGAGRANSVGFDGADLYVGAYDATSAIVFKLDTSLGVTWQRKMDFTGSALRVYGLGAGANGYVVAGYNDTPSPKTGMAYKERLDGTVTGTFGSWAYGTPAKSTSTTTGAGAFTGSLASGSFTDTGGALTPSAYAPTTTIQAV